MEIDYNKYDPLSIREFTNKAYPGLVEEDIFFLENWNKATVNKLLFVGWNQLKCLYRKSRLMRIATDFCTYLTNWANFQENLLEGGSPAPTDQTLLQNGG